MIRFYLLLQLIFFKLVINGQNYTPIVSTPGFDFSLFPNGIFTSNNSYGAAIFYPSGTSNPVIANSGIWIAGRMPNGDLRSSINLNILQTDFSYGPLKMELNQTLDSANWFRTWELMREEVKGHRSNYLNSTYTTPLRIIEWPANPPNGYDGFLAPFYDWNSNGIYDPIQGDVPIMEGDYTIYSVYNDYGKNRISEIDTGLGVEIKQFNYIYFDSDNKLILLTRLLVTNKNNFEISNFKLGVYSEVLLGSGNKNFVRTSPSLNAMIAYNSTAYDSIYGDKIPGLSLIFLNKRLASTMYVSKDDNVVTGLPTNPTEVNNYLSARWKNGKILTYGSNGIDGGLASRFVYPGLDDTSNQSFEWTEENSGSNPGIRNMLLNFDSLNISGGQTTEYRYAYQITPDANSSIQTIKSNIERTQTQFKNGQLTSVDNPKTIPEINIYPNPLFENSELNVQSKSPVLQVEIFDINGSKVIETKFLDGQKYVNVTLSVPHGVYIVKIVTSDGVVFRRLLIN